MGKHASLPYSMHLNHFLRTHCIAIQLFDVRGRFLHIAEIGEIFTIPEITQSDQHTLACIFEANESISAAIRAFRGDSMSFRVSAADNSLFVIGTKPDRHDPVHQWRGNAGSGCVSSVSSR